MKCNEGLWVCDNVFRSIIKNSGSILDFQYGIVFDAGSSHTMMYVYKWDGDPQYKTAIAKQVHACPVKGKDIYILRILVKIYVQ